MEQYCYLHYRITCPVCGNAFDDAKGQLRFFWGELGAEYHLGDAIRWGDEKQGPLRQLGRAVFGAAKVRGVRGLARVCVFDSDDDYSIWQCAKCQTEFDSPVISIDDNIITGARLLTKPEVVRDFGLERGDHDVLYVDPDSNTWKIFDDGE